VASTWLGEAIGPDAAGHERYLCDVDLPITQGRRIALRFAAIITLGTPVRTANGCFVAIRWRGLAGMTLYPSFDGQLRIADGQPALECAPEEPARLCVHVHPGLHVIAGQGMTDWFLARVSATLAASP